MIMLDWQLHSQCAAKVGPEKSDAAAPGLEASSTIFHSTLQQFS